MSQGALKGLSIGCFVLCAILLCVAWERYNSNVKAVEAMNRMMQSSPFGGASPFGGMVKQMTGNEKMEPGVPAATTYALLFAVLSAVGGGVCIVLSQKKSAASNSPG